MGEVVQYRSAFFVCWLFYLLRWPENQTGTASDSPQFCFAPAAFTGYSHTVTTEIKISQPLESALLCFTGERLVKAKP